ncbi:MAG: hypothetical protein JW768_11405 [Chitinispirillaceae bacterium]|nr:hypothetical protein [Chitinispirillaceae bacterium]
MSINLRFATCFAMIAAAVTVIHAAHLRYSLASLTESSLHINFTMPAGARQTTDPVALFAFSTRPAVSFNIQATVTGPSNTIALPVRTLSSGWMGSHYLQWIGIDLSRVLDGTSSSLSGSLTIAFRTSLFRPGTSGEVRNNMLLAHTVSPPALSKKSPAAFIPDRPFGHGIKMGIVKDGICELTAEALQAKGVPVAAIPSRRYRLFVQDREVPLYVTASPSAPLGPGDRILFYGNYLRGSSSHYTQYSNTNVYWLTWTGTDAGIRVATVSGEQRVDETRFTKDSVELMAQEVRDTIHIEKDEDIRWLGSIDNPEEMTEAVPDSGLFDNWYWGFVGMTELTSYAITIPSPARNGAARIRVGFMGLTNEESDPADHQVQVLVNNDPAGANNVAVWDGQKPHTFASDTFPASLLKPGENTISFVVTRRSYEDRSALNWIEMEYPRGYRAQDDKLVFKGGSNAVRKVTQFEVSGFSSSSLEVWDLTKHRIFKCFKVKRGSGNDRSLYSLVFQDSIPTPSVYYAQSVEQRTTPAWMVRDTLRTDWDTCMGADYLVIGPDWADTIVAPLCAVHRDRGLRTAFIDINDIYNFFSFGIRNPESIRSLLSMLVGANTDRPPRFLLLAGDCTHDLDKKNQERTIVPTRLSQVPGWGAASDDDYFVTVQGEDQFADLCVGRFPAENPSQLAIMVEKSVRYIVSPSRGFWRDNLLVASGYETDFTSYTHRLAGEVIGPRMNILRMDADPRSMYYKDELSAATTMAGHINAGIFALSFNGHGGGNIWSDSRFFGYNDLGKLHNGQWGTSGRLPVVFSFTCLTGFFESVFYRSLGEEFVRTDMNGALCFYGASAYTSKTGNMKLNRILLELALDSRPTTVGELIRASEMTTLVRNGPTHIPLTRQYNLLGDPALPWELTPDTLSCSLTENALAPGESLSVRGVCAPVSEGSVYLTVHGGPALWNRSLVTVEGGSFAESFGVKDSVRTASGMVRAYAWNDSFEVRGWATFSKDTIMVRDLRVAPPSYAFGDTVSISCSIARPTDTSRVTLYCLYAVASPHATDAEFNGVRMEEDSTGRWATPQNVVLTFTDDYNQMLLVYFRIQAGEYSKESSLYSFPIAGRSDLAFTGSSLPVTWKNDSLRIDFEVLNKGSAASPPFTVAFLWGSEPSADTFAVLHCTDQLKAGKVWNSSAVMPDTQGAVPFFALINGERTFEEMSFDNNRGTGALRTVSRSLTTTADTLLSLGGGLLITPVRNFSNSRKVFLFSDRMQNARPLLTGSRWLALRGDSLCAMRIGVRPALNEDDSLLWIWRLDSLPGEFPAGATQTASGKLSVMHDDSILSAWRHIGGYRDGNAAELMMKTGGQGPFAAALLEDTRPPSIQVSVYGRELRFLDYAAKDQPFNILLADPSGVSPASVAVTLNRKELPGDIQSKLQKKGDLRNLTITTYPPPENAIDSLFVTATDLAGNASEESFAYKPGTALEIQVFSCHPNPFHLRARGVNGPPQTVIFAFQLTNAADITLNIYTVTGKKIWTVERNMLEMYGEIEWNGRDKDNYRIANGTYYAKLIATSGKRSVKKTIRIAKLEGY